MHRYKELDIWKKSVALATIIYQLTDNMPDSEKFGLISQMRRSSVSIASNIAEGAGRGYNKSFANFLCIAAGSLYELETQLIISRNVGFLEDSVLAECKAEIDHLANMLYKFKEKVLENAR